MTGVLLVSYSLRLAEGVKELVDELDHGAVPVWPVGGVDELGVSVEAVLAAARALLQRPDVEAVVGLGDLGGAIIALETSVDVGHLEGVLWVADAPLVEGAVAAVMAAAAGGAATNVVAAAEEAATQRKR